MPMPEVTVTGSWLDTPRGYYEILVPEAWSNTVHDVRVPKGRLGEAYRLRTRPNEPQLAVTLPCTDAEGNIPVDANRHYRIRVVFDDTSRLPEIHPFSAPTAIAGQTVDLADVLLPDSVMEQGTTGMMVGVPGGLAQLNADGIPTDADGNPMVPPDLTAYTVKASNLSDLPDIPTARINLGLGSAATSDAADFEAAGAVGSVQSALTSHEEAADPHGDRAYVDTQMGTLGTAATSDSGDFDASGSAAAAQAFAVQRANHEGEQAQSTVTGLAAALLAKADLVGGVLPTNQLPSLAVIDTFPVEDEPAMLALTAQRGDVALRADSGMAYMLGGDDPTVLADWKAISIPNAVATVNGQTGVVVLGKADVGLDQAENTSDANKPVSTAQQAALGLKADASALTTHTSDTTNPHSVTKAQVGLDQAENTSDANKPVSTAQQAALDAKLSKASNLSDLPDIPATRVNLGLGSAATSDSTDFDASGAAAAAQAYAVQRANHTGEQPQSSITGLLGVLTAKADLVGGKIPTSQLPAVSVGTQVTVADETARFALTTASVQNSDVVVQTDTGTRYLVVDDAQLNAADGYLALNESTGAVDSVNGQTGVVVLSKADLDLALVDNTSDADKPVSTAQQAALDGKAPLAHNHDGDYAPLAHTTNTANPHSVTKAQVGLGNVDDTSDVAKPVSTAQQTAIDAAEQAAKDHSVQRANHTGEQAQSTVTNLVSDLAAKANLVNGLVPTSELPAVVTHETVTVANEAARFALTTGDVQNGDMVIQSDDSSRWWVGDDTNLNSAAGYVVAPDSAAVDSVNGQTGVVVLGKADVGLDQAENTSDANKPVSTATQTALDGKAPTAHGHAAADITSGILSRDRMPYPLSWYGGAVTDWHSIVSVGWYQSPAATTNAPDGNAHHGLLVGTSDNDLVLTLWQQDDASVKWQAAKVAGVWGAWERVYSTESALDGRYSLGGHDHSSSDVTDFSEAVDDRVNALIVAGTNLTKVYDDASDTLTLNASGLGGDAGTVLGWKRPEDYGAIDGVDDSATLAAMKADLVNGDTIYLTPGVTYSTGSDGFRLSNFTGLNVIAHGAKWIRPNNTVGTTKSPFMVENSTTLRIYGLDVEMPNNAARESGFAGIRLEHVTDFEIRGCYSRNARGAGMFLTDCHAGKIIGNWVYNSWADGIHMTNYGSDGCTGIEVAHNHCFDTGDDSIAVVSYMTGTTSRCADITAHDNHIYRSGARGMAIVGGKNINYHDNTIDGTSSAGIYCFQESSWDSYSIDDCQIRNNYIENANTLGGGFHGGIFTGGNVVGRRTNNVLVEGNTVKNCGNQGIVCRTDTGDGERKGLRFINNTVEGTGTNAPTDAYTGRAMHIYDAEDVEVRGNKVLLAGGDGICVVGAEGRFARVQDNEVTGAGSIGTTVDGIRCHTTGTTLFTITGNVVYDTYTSLDWELQTHELPAGDHIIRHNIADGSTHDAAGGGGAHDHDGDYAPLDHSHGSGWQEAAQATNPTDESAVSAWATGTTGAATHAGIGLAFLATDSSVPDASWTDGFTTRVAGSEHSWGSTGKGTLQVAEKAIVDGATAGSTADFTGGSDQANGAVVVLGKPGVYADTAFVQQALGGVIGGVSTADLTLPAAPTRGNLLVVAVAVDKNSGYTLPAGWTQSVDIVSASTSLQVFWKVADGTEITVGITRESGTGAGDSAWYGEYAQEQYVLASPPSEIVEYPIGSGTWTADAPARANGLPPITFSGRSDPEDPVDGVATPANISPYDRWAKLP